MADTEVIITTVDVTNVIVDSVSEVSVIITEGSQGPKGAKGEAGVNRMNDLSDVDITNIQDGSLLVYKQQTQKWLATKDLDSQAIDAGHY